MYIFSHLGKGPSYPQRLWLKQSPFHLRSPLNRKGQPQQILKSSCMNEETICLSFQITFLNIDYGPNIDTDPCKVLTNRFFFWSFAHHLPISFQFTPRDLRPLGKSMPLMASHLAWLVFAGGEADV